MPFITVVAEPPAQYVHRFSGPVIERVLPLAEARRACARMGVWADGCAWTSKGRCYIVIPRGGPVGDLNAYRRHEIAHCNGWRDHHAGSRSARAKAPYVGAAGSRTARAPSSAAAPPVVPPTAY